MLVLPEGLEDLDVQTDVVGYLETLQILLALDRRFVFLETGDQLNLGEIQLSESQGTLVLILQTGKAVTIDWAFPNTQTPTQILTHKLGRVEEGGAVDVDGVTDHGFSSRKGCEVQFDSF